jgi:hypothetical protein
LILFGGGEKASQFAKNGHIEFIMTEQYLGRKEGVLR